MREVTLALQNECGKLEIYSFHATHFYHHEPVGRADLAHHPVDVVFYSLFRNVEPRRHLLVGEAIPNQTYQLLFPQAETKILLQVQTWQRNPVAGDPSK